MGSLQGDPLNLLYHCTVVDRYFSESSSCYSHDEQLLPSWWATRRRDNCDISPGIFHQSRLCPQTEVVGMRWGKTSNFVVSTICTWWRLDILKIDVWYLKGFTSYVLHFRVWILCQDYHSYRTEHPSNLTHILGGIKRISYKVWVEGN